MVCKRKSRTKTFDAIAAPDVVLFVKAACKRAKSWYDDKAGNPGKARLPIWQRDPDHVPRTEVARGRPFSSCDRVALAVR
jgi:hypothetical protein